MICMGCHLIRYCSNRCKEKDEGVHEYECKALQACKKAHLLDEGADPGRDFRAIARLHFEQQRLGEEWWAPIDALLTHLYD